MTRNTHEKDGLLHQGMTPDYAVLLASAIGPLPAGTTLHDFLVALDAATTDLERRVIAYAWIQGIISGSFTADAEVVDEGIFAFAAEAVVRAVLAGTLTADAAVSILISGSFTADAVAKRTIGPIQPWTWINRLDLTGVSPLRGVAYGAGRWVAPDGGSLVYTALHHGTPWSPAPTWTSHSTGGTTGWDIAHDGTTWVVVGDDLRTATDPTSTWTQRSNPSQFLQFVTFANNHWVSGGGSGGTKVLITAGLNPTGTWTSRSTSSFTGLNQITDIKYGNGLWVGISGDRTVATATDPTSTWTNRGTLAAAGIVTSIVYGNGYWVAAGYTAGPLAGALWYTTNPSSGTAWTVAAPPSTSVVYKILFTDDQFIIAGTTNTGARYVAAAPSPSGPWTLRQPTTEFGFPNFITIGADSRGALMAVGDDGDSSHAIAEITYSTSPTQFHADATLHRSAAGSFTADAEVSSGAIVGQFVTDAFVAGWFTADAVIAGTGGLTFEAGTFETGAFE